MRSRLALIVSVTLIVACEEPLPQTSRSRREQPTQARDAVAREKSSTKALNCLAEPPEDLETFERKAARKTVKSYHEALTAAGLTPIPLDLRTRKLSTHGSTMGSLPKIKPKGMREVEETVVGGAVSQRTRVQLFVGKNKRLLVFWGDDHKGIAELPRLVKSREGDVYRIATAPEYKTTLSLTMCGCQQQNRSPGKGTHPVWMSESFDVPTTYRGVFVLKPTEYHVNKRYLQGACRSPYPPVP